MKCTKSNLFFLVPLVATTMSIYGGGFTVNYFEHPYGVNAWEWPLETCQLYRGAHLDRYRIMVDWGHFERSRDNYDWTGSGHLNDALDNGHKVGARLSLCVYRSPRWARSHPDKILSYSPEEYAEFVKKCVEYCEGKYPGIVEAVEVENEEPTATWQENIKVTHGTDQRDASWCYADTLKATYKAVQAYNAKHGTNILVIMDGIWEAAYHHLDELYQLGCKDYFDRLNFHYYVVEKRITDAGKPEDPADTSTIWHFITNLRYVKYIAEEWGDTNKLLWLSEYGWRYYPDKDPDCEVKRPKYNKYVIDICRRSGFVDRVAPYVGAAFWGGPEDGHDDGMALIYVDNHKTPSYHKKTPLYKMYVEFGNKYPKWNIEDAEPIKPIAGASKDLDIVNPGFEMGKRKGWRNVKIDSKVKHSGKYSGRQVAPDNIMTQYYKVEPGKLYEVIAWIKVDTENSDACMVFPSVKQWSDDEGETVWGPANYYGIVDTRNYPDKWRRIRFMYLSPKNAKSIAINFTSVGKGTFWIDDLQVKALNMPEPVIPKKPLKE